MPGVQWSDFCLKWGTPLLVPGLQKCKRRLELLPANSNPGSPLRWNKPRAHAPETPLARLVRGYTAAWRSPAPPLFHCPRWASLTQTDAQRNWRSLPRNLRQDPNSPFLSVSSPTHLGPFLPGWAMASHCSSGKATEGGGGHTRPTEEQ